MHYPSLLTTKNARNNWQKLSRRKTGTQRVKAYHQLFVVHLGSHAWHITITRHKLEILSLYFKTAGLFSIIFHSMLVLLNVCKWLILWSDVLGTVLQSAFCTQSGAGKAGVNNTYLLCKTFQQEVSECFVKISISQTVLLFLEHNSLV